MKEHRAMVNIDNNVIEQDEAAIFDRILGSGMRYISFAIETPPGSGDYVSKPIGTTYSGVTTEPLSQRQATDFTTKQPKFYSDGKPIVDIIAVLQTDLREDEEDTGIRGLTFSSGMRAALMQEVKRLGIKRFGVGTRITVELVGFKPNPKGRPSKLFNVTLEPTGWVPPAERVTGEVLQDESYRDAATATQWAKPAPVQSAAPVVPDQAAAAALAMLQAPAKPTIDPALIGKVELLVNNGFDRATAIQAVVTQQGGDEAFRSALDAEVPF